MPSNAPEEKPPQPGGLQSMMARLRGMVQALKSDETETTPEREILPNWDGLEPIGTEPSTSGESVARSAVETDSVGETRDRTSVPGGAEPSGLARRSPPSCPHCGSPRGEDQAYCSSCGWIYPVGPPATAPQTASVPRTRIKNRYELVERVGERGKVVRYRGLDWGDANTTPVAVIVVREPLPEPVEAVASNAAAASEPGTEADPGDSGPRDGAPAALLPAAEAVPLEPAWPSVAWEHALLQQVQRLVLPRVLDHFVEAGFEYLVEELPAGLLLWDAWDEPENCADQRFGWLKQIAGTLHQLHEHKAILEALRPDIVVIMSEGQPRITDLSDLLPLPLPANPPIRATYYTAPELVLTSELADARADLYSFGAMLYALHLGRELTELDFELQGVPKSILQRFPDIHPLFGRLVSKTFCRDLNSRLPTEEAAAMDPSGFAELIDLLEACRRTLDVCRLEISAWTTTGMMRAGNEDAFALFHAAEAHNDELHDAALILLADGMGGYEAGEVAASMAVDVMRKNLLQRQPFTTLASDPASSADEQGSGSSDDRLFDVAACQRLIADALKDANRQVYQVSQTDSARRGMGCTAEVVYLDGRSIFIGHVGDSRTYHLHEGRLIQRTRDQTWVNRMVDLGALSPEEAEQHPRRCELQQAIGGHPDVDPALYHSRLKPGDWVVVCSDGLSNQVSADTLKELLQSAVSAESAARRLVNLVNLEGATDNATVVVVRAT